MQACQNSKHMHLIFESFKKLKTTCIYLFLFFCKRKKAQKLWIYFLQAKKSSKIMEIIFASSQISKNMNFFVSLTSSENMDFIFCKLQKYQKTWISVLTSLKTIEKI